MKPQHCRLLQRRENTHPAAVVALCTKQGPAIPRDCPLWQWSGPLPQGSPAGRRAERDGVPAALAGRRPQPGAWLGRWLLTHVKMEKKEKAMAARAASVPSLSGLSWGLDTCHWLAR